MADIAFRSLGKIIEAALKIKEAVETVKHNDRECREIERCVARVSALLERLEQTTETMKDPAMSGPLEDLAESVEKALELVSECQQQRHTFTVLRLWSASNMARELRQVQEDIVRKLQLGTFAHVTILLTINIQYAGARRSTPHPQVTVIAYYSGMCATTLELFTDFVTLFIIFPLLGFFNFIF